MRVPDARAPRLILLAAAAGLLLRLAFGFGYWVDKPLTHDEREYLALAHSLASGRGFAYSESLETGTAQQFGRAPGYPLFLVPFIGSETQPASTPSGVKVAQSVVGALGVWLIGLWAWRCAGPTAGTVAASVAAIYPPLVIMPAYVLSETLYSAVALGSALVLQRAFDRPSQALGVASGILAGSAALIRPAMLLFLPLAFVWLLARRRTALALVLALGATAIITPWTIRNIREHGRFVLIASEGGVTFWTGNHPLARGEGDLAANPDIKRAELAFRGAHPGLTAEQLEPLYYRAAFRWIGEHPHRWIALLGRKMFYTVVPAGPSYAVHSGRYRLASIVPYLIVLPFGVVGLMRLWRSTTRPMALFLLAGSSILMCLVFFPQERFRLPIIDPVLIVSAAALAGRRPS